MFNDADTDKSGKVDVQELEAAIEKHENDKGDAQVQSDDDDSDSDSD